MNEIKIDEVTGLPELPKDHFWRVNPNAIDVYRRLPDTDFQKYRRHFTDRDNWGVKSEYVSEIRTSFFGLNKTQYVKFVNRRIFIAGDSYGGDSVTRANLLERAINIRKEMLEYEENQKIMGEYPPKKFEG